MTAATSGVMDGYDVSVTNLIDRVIRISTAMAVLAVAGVAAYVSYWHAYAVVRAHGESGVTARLEPATIDGLVYASSMVILYAARHGSPVLLAAALSAHRSAAFDVHVLAGSGCGAAEVAGSGFAVVVAGEEAGERADEVE